MAKKPIKITEVALRDAHQSPVSYTHLRAAQGNGPSSEWLLLSCANMPYALQNSFSSVKRISQHMEFPLPGATPVSYTHLDVYKRQG